MTLFHKLPDQPDTLEYFNNLQYGSFEMKVIGLRHLGAGVAYQIESPELQQLRKEAGLYFWPVLSPQDRQVFKPHITIQNKVTPEASKALLRQLSAPFKPFTVNGIGLDLWEYLGGPWRHNFSYDFIK